MTVKNKIEPLKRLGYFSSHNSNENVCAALYYIQRPDNSYVAENGGDVSLERAWADAVVSESDVLEQYDTLKNS